MLPEIAAQREPERGADFGHAQRPELSNTFSQTFLRNRNRIVQIDCARRFHAVFFIQNYFGRHAANGRSDRSDGNGGQIRDGAAAGQHNDRPFLVVRGRLIETNVATRNLASRYSDGHAASASQASPSLGTCGLLE
jgi:hypothetical protein